MSAPINDDEAASLYGPLRPIFLPLDAGMTDPAELGRAMAAWRYNLSRQEIDLLEYVATGLTNKEIAAHLCVAEENTVKKRLRRIFNKLAVNNRVQAATIAMKYGFGGKPASLSQSTE